MRATLHAHPQGQAFKLMVEHDDDQAFVDALHAEGNCVEVVTYDRTPMPHGRYRNTGVQLLVGSRTTRALETQAARQALRSLRELFRLGLGDAAHHGHVHAHATHPQPEAKLTALLEQLEVVVQILLGSVCQGEIACQEMLRAHVVSSEKVEVTSIVAQAGVQA